MPRKKSMPMHPADITAGLRKAGSSQAAVAEHFGVSDVTVCSVVAGRQKNKRVAEHIAGIIGKSVDDIWGAGKYDYPQRESFRERSERAVA